MVRCDKCGDETERRQKINPPDPMYQEFKEDMYNPRAWPLRLCQECYNSVKSKMIRQKNHTLDEFFSPSLTQQQILEGIKWYEEDLERRRQGDAQ